MDFGIATSNPILTNLTKAIVAPANQYYVSTSPNARSFVKTMGSLPSKLGEMALVTFPDRLTGISVKNIVPFLNTASGHTRPYRVDIPMYGHILRNIGLRFQFNSPIAAFAVDSNVYGDLCSLIKNVEFCCNGKTLESLTGERIRALLTSGSARAADHSFTMKRSSALNERSTGSVFVELPFWFSAATHLHILSFLCPSAVFTLQIEFNPMSTVFGTATRIISSITAETQCLWLIPKLRRLIEHSPRFHHITAPINVSRDNDVTTLNILDTLHLSNEVYESSIVYDIAIPFSMLIIDFEIAIQDPFGVIDGARLTPRGRNRYNYWRNFIPGRPQIKSYQLFVDNVPLTTELPWCMNSLMAYTHHRYQSPCIRGPLARGEGALYHSFCISPNSIDIQPSGCFDNTHAKLTVRVRLNRDTDNFSPAAIDAGNGITSKTLNIRVRGYEVLEYTPTGLITKFL